VKKHLTRHRSRHSLSHDHLTGRIAGPVVLAATMAYLLVGTLVSSAGAVVVRRTRAPRDRGALSLEQAIVTAVLSAAAIALGAVIVNAITTHSGNIR